MKKIFKALLFSIIFLPAIVLLYGCNEQPPGPTPLTLTSSMLSLEYETTTYNGREHKPTVKVTAQGHTFDATEFATYENNIEVGTATLTLNLTKGNSYVKAGTATKEFTIEEKVIEVSSLQQLNNAINQTDSNHIIKLTKDITSNVAANGYIQPVLICPESKHLDDVTIDLNNHTIKTEVWIVKEYYENSGIIGGSGKFHITDNTANITLFNGNIGAENADRPVDGVDYGIILKVANGFNVTLNNIKSFGKSAGIYSNGQSKFSGNSVINATNCSFSGLQSNDNAGAYLASNITTNFENCSFTGYTAYYTKSGTHNLTNNSFVANGAGYIKPTIFSGNGFNCNGSAIVVDSSQGYANHLVLNLYNSDFFVRSAKAFQIDEVTTYKVNGSVEAYSQINVFVSSLDEVENFNVQTQNNRINFIVNER